MGSQGSLDCAGSGPMQKRAVLQTGQVPSTPSHATDLHWEQEPHGHEKLVVRVCSFWLQAAPSPFKRKMDVQLPFGESSWIWLCPDTWGHSPVIPLGITLQ